MAESEHVEPPDKKRKLASVANEQTSRDLKVDNLEFEKKNEKQKRLPPSNTFN